MNYTENRSSFPVLTLLGLLLWLSSGISHSAWQHHADDVMGTRIRAEVWHADPQVRQAAIDAVFAEMRRIDATYSPYIASSALSELNAGAVKGWVPVSDEMLMLLQKSRRISELTDGAFDVTYASVGRFYDYREGITPDDVQLAAAVEAIDYRHIEVSGKRVRFSHPATYVDLGGIAKGFAVDQAIALLERHGITQGAVSAGGDSRILGDRRGEPWVVGVRHPRQAGAYALKLPLADAALSTSGDYERYFERDGERIHHILDPSSGRSASGALSVTILGSETLLTDALSTSVFVLGVSAGIDLINKLPGIDAIVIDPRGRVHYSMGLMDPAEEEPAE